MIMNSLIEIAKAFYGVIIPKRVQKYFCKTVTKYLDAHYSIETAIGMALRELKIY